MIVTVTPAPAIDWTIRTSEFVLDSVNRADQSTREPSGKGINVSWALHRAGVATTAIFPGGSQTGQFMDEALVASGLDFVRIDTSEEIRTNITLLTPGHSTKINEKPIDLSPGIVNSLTDAVLRHAERAEAVVISGSLPSSMPPTWVPEVVAEINTTGAGSIVDSSGIGLKTSLNAAPSLIKPNVHELAALVDRDLVTLADVVTASHEAIDQGAQSVLASLGRDGAIFVDGNSVVLGSSAGTPFVNSVGAGDALLSGFIAASGCIEDKLHHAILWASSAVAHDSTLFPIQHQFASNITVTDDFDANYVLTEPAMSELSAWTAAG